MLHSLLPVRITRAQSWLFCCVRWVMAYAHCLSLFSVSAVSPTSVNWWSSAVPSTAPPSLTDAATTLDSASGRLYIIGGKTSAGQPTNDVWTSTNSGAAWTCESCLSTSSFSARSLAAAAVNHQHTAFLLGGTDGTETWQNLYSSTNFGADWTLLTNNGPWLLQVNLGAPSMLFDQADNMWIVVPRGHVYFSPLVGGYNSFQDSGEISLGGSVDRLGFAVHLSQDKKMYLGGGNDGSGNSFQDMWVTDVSDGAGSHVSFTLLTSAAPWSPRSLFSMFEDSSNNLYVFGQSQPPNTHQADLMWYSTNGASRGTFWTRIDSSSNSTIMPDCAKVWPFPASPVLGQYGAMVDANDRLVIITAGNQPTGTAATALIQLLATANTTQTNSASLTQQTSCRTPPPPELSSTGVAPPPADSTGAAPAHDSTGAGPTPDASTGAEPAHDSSTGVAPADSSTGGAPVDLSSAAPASNSSSTGSETHDSSTGDFPPAPSSNSSSTAEPHPELSSTGPEPLFNLSSTAEPTPAFNQSSTGSEPMFNSSSSTGESHANLTSSTGESHFNLSSSTGESDFNLSSTGEAHFNLTSSTGEAHFNDSSSAQPAPFSNNTSSSTGSEPHSGNFSSSTGAASDSTGGAAFSSLAPGPTALPASSTAAGSDSGSAISSSSGEGGASGSPIIAGSSSTGSADGVPVSPGSDGLSEGAAGAIAIVCILFAVSVLGCVAFRKSLAKTWRNMRTGRRGGREDAALDMSYSEYPSGGRYDTFRDV